MILTHTDEPVAGIPDESSLVKSYASQRNLKLPLVGLRYFQAFSCYRLASIVQGVYARSVWGNASDKEYAQYYLGMVKPIAEAGLAFTRYICVSVYAYIFEFILCELKVCVVLECFTLEVCVYSIIYIMPMTLHILNLLLFTVLPSLQHLI